MIMNVYIIGNGFFPRIWYVFCKCTLRQNFNFLFLFAKIGILPQCVNGRVGCTWYWKIRNSKNSEFLILGFSRYLLVPTFSAKEETYKGRLQIKIQLWLAIFWSFSWVVCLHMMRKNDDLDFLMMNLTRNRFRWDFVQKKNPAMTS